MQTEQQLIDAFKAALDRSAAARAALRVATEELDLALAAEREADRALLRHQLGAA